MFKSLRAWGLEVLRDLGLGYCLLMFGFPFRSTNF